MVQVQSDNCRSRQKLKESKWRDTGAPTVLHRILRRRSYEVGWSGLSRLRSLAPLNHLIQVIPVRPIRAEVLFIEQPLGATTQTDLIGIALASHRPAHPAMPASPERDQYHSRQASGHYPNRPQPLVFPRFFAVSRAFSHHSSQGTHKSQHRLDCPAEQTQGVVPHFSFYSPYSSPPPKGPMAPCTNGHCGTSEKNITLGLRGLYSVRPGTKSSNAAHFRPARIEGDEIEFYIIVTA